MWRHVREFAGEVQGQDGWANPVPCEETTLGISTSVLNVRHWFHSMVPVIQSRVDYQRCGLVVQSHRMKHSFRTRAGQARLGQRGRPVHHTFDNIRVGTMTYDFRWMFRRHTFCRPCWLVSSSSVAYALLMAFWLRGSAVRSH
ncbi:hypothetical protein BP00DRAFT_272172 [Aspergillus indologenus CBS 114.80]|uniref:Uncharacterized protein n=1 Tax=Aspergillus indologenus CBS 114.80 TaxID=1450541 RepID=A0A2V5II35_9EURO|nr:hypothetical protein BP00DRAFT_272172 [Aspergillus indologenus CBS 114.80]